LKKVFGFVANYFRQTDKWLLLLCIAASSYSVALLAGIQYSEYITQKQFLTQLLASAFGIVCAVILSKIDYHVLAELWKLHSALGYFLVILTLFLGQNIGGNKAWLNIPFINIGMQPSEFLKISFILTYAFHLDNVKDELNSPLNIALLLAHGMLPILMIHFIQRDDGTALVFFVIFFVMLFAAGLSWKYVGYGAAASVVFVPILWFFVLSENQKDRFIALFNPEANIQQTMHQQYNASLSIGSGKIWGNGLFTGEHRYIYAMHNDFIFAFVGEALGFIGSLSVVALLIAICLRILFTSTFAHDILGKNICVGVFAMIAFQSIINIGMCLGLLPVIGITLPFFSAGGTSVTALYLGVGLALSVYLHSKRTLFLGR